ncbi:hypothetical protein [Aliarcobacter lanthieri]|uniref:hypothetical protein n=1 Tax=Aliarcobacter lanthieri TaxID=1355374 RepID=UPI003AB0A6FF
MKLEDLGYELKKDGEKLVYDGSLDLSGTGITSLPDNLSVGGSLYLSNTGITSLPDNLSVSGYLDLSNTGITSLPDNLSVGGSLYLSNTGITSLPDNLSVSGYLDLRNTGITNYPLVHNCGIGSRTIYLDRNDKNIICIGCFRGTQDEAIQAISEKYKYNHNERDKYIQNVKDCFDLWEQLKGKQHE